MPRSAAPLGVVQSNSSGIPLRAPKGAYSPGDFERRGRYGQGSYSEVWKAALKATGEEYALKIMKVSHIRKENKEDYVKMERLILDSLDHPGVVRLMFTFRTDLELCMGMEACDGGELFYQIQQKGKLTGVEAQFYAAELVDVMEYIHQYLVHRDIKPENLLLTSDGHLKLIDFGSAMLIRPLPSSVFIRPNAEETPSGSFVGTAEYVSPEVVRAEPVTIGADLWALGCVIYQMLEGKSPFKAASEFLCFQKVTSRDFKFPSHFPPAAKDLIDRLLDLVPGNRPGAGALGYAALKSHPFFNGVDWSRVREAVPPLLAKANLLEGCDGESKDDTDDGMWEAALMGIPAIFAPSDCTTSCTSQSSSNSHAGAAHPRPLVTGYVGEGEMQILGTQLHSSPTFQGQ